MTHKWELDIRGTDGLLEFLAPSFTQGDTVIFPVGDGYRIRSAAFEVCETARDVRDKANEIATSLVGAAAMLGRRGALTIGGAYRLRYDGRRDVFALAEAAVMAVGIPTASLSVIRADGTVETPRPADPAAPWVRLAASDDAVAQAFRIFAKAEELGWVELYKLYEIINADAGDSLYTWVAPTDQAGGVREIKRFKHTANSVGAVGDDARHGVETTEPPKNPMPLRDAQALWLRVTRAWLDSKETE